jgi:hypothetical protein
VGRKQKSITDRHELPINNTVKLTEPLRERVGKAMQVTGFTVWSEFCRVALTEKCQRAERDLRERDASEFARRYGSGTK